MDKGTELYIETSIHSLVDIVYGRVYRQISQELKNTIQTSHITVDATTADSKQYLPPFDCLFYPTVSVEKCADDYNESDWIKFEHELEKHLGKPLPTLQYYMLNRLTSELRYFLKLAIHAKLNPHEGIGTLGFEYFVRHYFFILSNFPLEELQNQYENFWCAVLETLKTDKSIMRSGPNGNHYPLGQFAIKEIDWLKSKIGC
jgi:hypothetical protein